MIAGGLKPSVPCAGRMNRLLRSLGQDDTDLVHENRRSARDHRRDAKCTDRAQRAVHLVVRGAVREGCISECRAARDGIGDGIEADRNKSGT